MKSKIYFGIMAITLSSCINDSESTAKNGDIFRTWRYSFVQDGFLCTSCNAMNPDTTKIDLTFYAPDSFREMVSTGSRPFSEERSGHFLRRNDSIIITNSFGRGSAYAFDSAAIIQLDYSAFVVKYNRAGSPFTLRFSVSPENKN